MPDNSDFLKDLENVEIAKSNPNLKKRFVTDEEKAAIIDKFQADLKAASTWEDILKIAISVAKAALL